MFISRLLQRPASSTIVALACSGFLTFPSVGWTLEACTSRPQPGAFRNPVSESSSSRAALETRLQDEARFHSFLTKGTALEAVIQHFGPPQRWCESISNKSIVLGYAVAEGCVMLVSLKAGAVTDWGGALAGESSCGQ